MSQVLQELCDKKLRDLYQKHQLNHPTGTGEQFSFSEFVQKKLDAIGKGRSGFNSRVQRNLTSLTRLVPDWKRRKEMIPLRMKTLLKIFLSKWFYRGLEWYEIELVLYLLDFNLGLECDLISPRTLQEKGFILIQKLFLDDEKKSLYSVGWDLLEIGNLELYLYSESDFHNVWNLGSVQSLRDFIFQPTLQLEHEGRKGIKKPRIRGYRDGKSSPRDPTLTALARKVDIAFFSQKEEKRLDDFWRDVEALTKIS